MKLALGLATAAAILIPTAVSAQTIEMQAGDYGELALGNHQNVLLTICTQMQPNVYFCAELETELVNSGFFNRNQVANTARVYAEQGGRVEWVQETQNKPQVGQLY